MPSDLFNLELPVWEAALRLAAALLCSGVIGWEREIHRRAAGLRTHMLIGLGSAGFALLGLELAAASAPAQGGVGGDATRIIQAIAMGVGFLGAGAIFHARAHVEGLTTAAGIWVVAAIGLSCGTGKWAIALLLTFLGLLTLTVLRVLEPSAPHGGGDEKGS